MKAGSEVNTSVSGSTLRQKLGVRCQPRSAPIIVPKTKATRMAVSIRPSDQGSADQTSESTFCGKDESE